MFQIVMLKNNSLELIDVCELSVPMHFNSAMCTCLDHFLLIFNTLGTFKPCHFKQPNILIVFFAIIDLCGK